MLEARQEAGGQLEGGDVGQGCRRGENVTAEGMPGATGVWGGRLRGQRAAVGVLGEGVLVREAEVLLGALTRALYLDD